MSERIFLLIASRPPFPNLILRFRDVSYASFWGDLHRRRRTPRSLFLRLGAISHGSISLEMTWGQYMRTYTGYSQIHRAPFHLQVLCQLKIDFYFNKNVDAPTVGLPNGKKQGILINPSEKLGL